MGKANTNRQELQVPRKAADFLRFFPGSFARLRKRIGISKSHLSMVVSGQRVSARVRKAILEEAARLARLHGVVHALDFEDEARRIAIRRGYERAIEIEEHARR
jgi:hypothetical protein